MKQYPPHPDIYQLRIVLRGISPLIWRRLLVRSDTTLAQLHLMLQLIFDWSNEHLHHFHIFGKDYGSDSGSCPCSLRLIQQPDKPGKIPSFLHMYEGGYHGLSSLFLPVSAGRHGVAVRHAPLGVAERLHSTAACPTTQEPPLPKRHRAPTPFAGLATKPPCAAWEPATAPRPPAPSAPPPRLVPTRGRRRQGATSPHCCPHPACRYRGWVGWGTLRANGHPNGGPWRQQLCVAWRRYVLETRGTLLYSPRASVELIVRVIACLAEGGGIRGTARVVEVDPTSGVSILF